MQIEGRELSLMVTHRELLETSLAQLQMLAAFLSDQLGVTVDGSAGVEARACNEILCGVSRLIETYQCSRVAPTPVAAQEPAHASAGQMTSQKAAHETGPWEVSKSATSHRPKDTVVQRRGGR